MQKNVFQPLENSAIDRDATISTRYISCAYDDKYEDSFARHFVPSASRFPTSYLRSSRIPYLPPGYYLFIIYLLITLYFYQLVTKRRKKIVHHQSSRFFLLDNSIEERAESIVFKIFHEITYL